MSEKGAWREFGDYGRATTTNCEYPYAYSRILFIFVELKWIWTLMIAPLPQTVENGCVGNSRERDVTFIPLFRIPTTVRNCAFRSSTEDSIERVCTLHFSLYPSASTTNICLKFHFSIRILLYLDFSLISSVKTISVLPPAIPLTYY